MVIVGLFYKYLVSKKKDFNVRYIMIQFIALLVSVLLATQQKSGNGYFHSTFWLFPLRVKITCGSTVTIEKCTVFCRNKPLRRGVSRVQVAELSLKNTAQDSTAGFALRKPALCGSDRGTAVSMAASERRHRIGWLSSTGRLGRRRRSMARREADCSFERV